MTQEEKAKAYDEALAKAREFYDSPRTCFTIDQLCEIFPSLAESEDERTRKAIIGIIKYTTAFDTDFTQEQMLAWLEKQKERGPLTKEEEYTLYRIIEYFEDGDEHPEWVELLRNIYNLPYVKQKEPTEELVYRLNGLMQDYIEEGATEEEKEHRLRCYRLFWDALEDLSFFEKQKEQNPAEIAPNQFDGVTYGMSGHSSEKPAEYPMTPSECYKPAEWSEEDDGVLEQIITAFRRIANGSEHYFSQDTAKVFEETLISLRHQSKQEWSDEDEWKLNEIIKYLEDKGDYRSCWVSFLKDLPNRFSLRPHWKPSKEEMEALDVACSGKLWYGDIYLNGLKRIREQLKKL